MRISNWSLNVSVKHFAMHLPGCTGKDAVRSRRSCDSILSNSRMVSPKFCRKWITTPSAPLRKLRDNLLMSRLPLLEEEGKKLVLNGLQDHNLLTSTTSQTPLGPVSHLPVRFNLGQQCLAGRE